MRRILPTVVAAACLLALTACNAGPGRASASRHGKPLVNPEGTVYFVPLGGFPNAAIARLVGHYKDTLGIEIQVLGRLPIDATLLNPRRNQVKAERLVASVHDAFPDRMGDPKSILIGITSEDIYPESMPWQFAFGWRSGDLRTAVVSTARMDLHYPGEPMGVASPEIRLLKMVTKDLGILYYRLPLSDDPKSVLYSDTMGLQELDAVGEEF